MGFIAFIKWLFGIKTIVPDTVKVPSTPAPQIEVVSPVIATTAKRPYMTTPMVKLLSLIRLHESGSAGYNADYANNNHWKLTDKTFDQVRTLARSQVTHGEKSSAIAAYQFLTTTLDSLKVSLKLKGTEVFDEVFQDDLAVALMIRRGYTTYMSGAITAEVFCNRLAMEWASLPVVTPVKGAHRQLKAGQSYYAGDGLNAALHKPAVILNAVRALRV